MVYDNIIRILRFIFAIAWIFFGLVWDFSNQAFNEAARRTYEAGYFDTYVSAKRFFIRISLFLAIGFFIFLTIDGRMTSATSVRKNDIVILFYREWYNAALKASQKF